MHATFLRIHVAAAAAALLLGAGSLTPGAARADEEEAFTSDFHLAGCHFSNRKGNRYFPLEPGFQTRLEGDSDGEYIVLVRTVLPQTRVVRFEKDGRRYRVRTRVVEEREWIDGELYEVSTNFYARCRETQDVFYFGEQVAFYEDGEVVSNDGSWIVGQGGALPGVIMPGTFLLGSRYSQEVAPGVAEDRAEHEAMGLEVETAAGVFSGCVGVLDTNPLDPTSEGDEKVYCPEVGLTVDEDISLVEFGRVHRRDGGDDGSDD